VEVQGVEGGLKRAAEAALTIRPNLAYTLKEVEEDLQKVGRAWAWAWLGCRGGRPACTPCTLTCMRTPRLAPPRMAARRSVRPAAPCVRAGALLSCCDPRRGSGLQRPTEAPPLPLQVFATGWFASVQPDAEDTRDGVKLFIKVGGAARPGRLGLAQRAGVRRGGAYQLDDLAHQRVLLLVHHVELHSQLNEQKNALMREVVCATRSMCGLLAGQSGPVAGGLQPAAKPRLPGGGRRGARPPPPLAAPRQGAA
jgi:hypothetical protein